MIWENTKLFLKLYYRPLAAMSRIIDEGSVIYGIAAVIAVSLLLQFAVTSRIYEQMAHSFATQYYHANATRRVYPQASTSAEQKSQANAGGAAATVKEGERSSLKDARQGAALETEEYADEEAYAGEEYAQQQPNTQPQPAMQPQPNVMPQALPRANLYAWWLVSYSQMSVLVTLATLAVIYVPLTVLLMILLESLGSFGVVLRRDFGSLLICTLMAWAAAHLPFALAGLALASVHLSAVVLLAIHCASMCCFALLMIFALRTLFGTSYARAVGVVSLSWTSFIFGAFVFSIVTPFLASPFILYYAWLHLRGEIGDINFSYRNRQNFRRCMEEATINPRNAEAHYQLGLIYRHRHQTTEAIERFKRAVETDARETDAHFQLGCIAREQGRLQEAIEYFGTVVAQDESHARNEIWREIGATYLSANMSEEAREALERYVERRPYDPEGLFYFGQAMEKLGHKEQAQDAFGRCIEAVKTTPYYRRSQVHKWRKLAQKQLSAFTGNASSLVTS
ncbi:MAG: tetratricopeptide repeat protein [Pyrinomonadaceae bacterium]